VRLQTSSWLKTESWTVVTVAVGCLALPVGSDRSNARLFDAFTPWHCHRLVRDGQSKSLSSLAPRAQY
jgi:hypothetical protein